MCKVYSPQDMLRQLFVEKYVLHVFSKNCNNEKMMQKLPFIYIQASVKGFFKVFPSSQLMFNKEFGLKIGKHVFYEMFGFDITENYLK